MDEPVFLPRRLAIRLLHEAQLGAGREVCGLIGAGGDGPVAVYPITNAAPAPERAFHLDAGEQVAAMARMRERGHTLWAIYHSHPTAPPAPSAQDLADAGYPDALQLIVSLDVKGVLDLRCWEYGGGAPRERVLKIRENT